MHRVKTWVSNSILIAISILWHTYGEHIELRSQYFKILTLTFSERYGLGWFAFLVILFCFLPSVKKCNTVTVRKKDQKYSEEPVFYMANTFSWLDVHLNHMAVFVQINKDLIFPECSRKMKHFCENYLSMSVLEQENTDTNTHAFSVVLPYSIWEVGSKSKIPVASSKSGSLLRLWNASCSSLGRGHSSTSCLIAKKTALVCTALTTRAENENRLEKQQDACNSLSGVSQNKIHLSSPDESHCFQMIWKGVSVPALKLESWQVFQNYVFMDRRTLGENEKSDGSGLDFYRIWIFIAFCRFFQMLMRSVPSESPGMRLWPLHFKIYRRVWWRAKFENDYNGNTPKGGLE